MTHRESANLPAIEGYHTVSVSVFLKAYADNMSLEGAALLAGVDPDAARDWLARPDVQTALHRRRSARIRSEGAEVALDALIALARGTGGVPAAVRRAAARDLLALAGHTEAAAAAEVAPQAGRQLHEMGADDLERIAAGAAATLAALRRQVGTVDSAADSVPPGVSPGAARGAGLL